MRRECKVEVPDGFKGCQDAWPARFFQALPNFQDRWPIYTIGSFSLALALLCILDFYPPCWDWSPKSTLMNSGPKPTTFLDLCYLKLTHPLIKFSFLKLLSFSLAFTITPSAYVAYILVAASLTRTVVGLFTPGPLLFSPYCFSCGASLVPIAYTTLITFKFRILDLTSEFLADGCIYCL